jgi:hypothetical protein
MMKRKILKYTETIVKPLAFNKDFIKIQKKSIGTTLFLNVAHKENHHIKWRLVSSSDLIMSDSHLAAVALP